MKIVASYDWRRRRLNQAGSIQHIALGILILVVAFFGVSRLLESHASAASSTITSGISGYCLDDYKNSSLPNTKVTAWKCNNSAAQEWSVAGDSLKHQDNTCLSIAGNSKVLGAKIVASNCGDQPGQVWLREKGGYFNPNSGFCLAVPSAKTGTQLVDDICQNLSRAAEQWSMPNPPTCKTGAEGDKVACVAGREWTKWQAGTPSHTSLLNTYTDGSSYEAWCADFVSYVYKQAGYPFTAAYDGWDENSANMIQNYGFTQHLASSGYAPKTGDIAYFNYNGGHVEIVAHGGKNPTFIYGNSAITDPSTGNGQMRANTITNDGSEGQLEYYLSPN